VDGPVRTNTLCDSSTEPQKPQEETKAQAQVQCNEGM
jgi:hypothetical protein